MWILFLFCVYGCNGNSDMRALPALYSTEHECLNYGQSISRKLIDGHVNVEFGFDCIKVKREPLNGK